MERYSSRALVLLIGLWLLSSAHAQVATNPQANGQDYFTADKSDGSYLSIVEKNHIRTIPDWIKQGRLNDAIADIKYTLDRFPNHPVSLQQLSMVAQMTKNTALGLSYFERAVALFPHYALTRAQYGLFLVSTNNVDAGIENLRQSIEMEPKLSAGYAGLAHAYAKKGDFEHAREAAMKARELGFNGKLPDGL
jgi:tetratricopeptide (TPR) repeat protein